MEPNDSGLSSYFHHHHQQPPPHHHQQSPNPATASPTNGILPNASSDRAPHMLSSYPHSVTSAVSSPLETVRRKRGRPRKYGTPEQAAAAKRLSSSSSVTASQASRKKDQAIGGGGSSSSASSSKKSQLAALGNSGQGFTPHIITVAAGEDVGQKIMLFMQQIKHEICILSASGSISNASLRQPATSGGNITYEGSFDILTLSGSYVRTELGGRTGGLSVCLSSTDGQIIGGGVGGPLTAAGPVQVIVGTFLVDSKKDAAAGVQGDISTSRLPSSLGGGSISSAGFPLAIDSSARNSIVRTSNDHQNIGAAQFLIQPRSMHLTSPRATDWMSGLDTRVNANFDLTGRTGHGAQQSPENGDYEHLAD